MKRDDLPYKQNDEGVSSVYRVVVTPENKVTVKINDEEVYSGDMEKDWDLLEPKEIDDAEDKKPEDWVGHLRRTNMNILLNVRLRSILFVHIQIVHLKIKIG